MYTSACLLIPVDTTTGFSGYSSENTTYAVPSLAFKFPSGDNKGPTETARYLKKKYILKCNYKLLGSGFRYRVALRDTNTRLQFNSLMWKSNLTFLFLVASCRQNTTRYEVDCVTFNLSNTFGSSCLFFKRFYRNVFINRNNNCDGHNVLLDYFRVQNTEVLEKHPWVMRCICTYNGHPKIVIGENYGKLRFSICIIITRRILSSFAFRGGPL